MHELRDLYDANRQPVGLRHRRGEPLPPSMYHLVVHVWMRNAKGQYLISKRHPDKPFPLLWECTAGSVLAGEVSLAGALREAREELGVVLDPQDGMRIQTTRRDAHQDICDVWLFHADVPLSRLVLQPSEVVDARWVDYEALLAMEDSGQLVPTMRYFRTLIGR